MTLPKHMTLRRRGGRVRPANLARAAARNALAAVIAIAVVASGAADSPAMAVASGARTSNPTRAPAPGATKQFFVVSPRGSDDSAGTAARPWRTVQKALDTLKPGERALVHRGAYGRARCERGKGGSATRGFVTLKAYPGEKPVIAAAADGVFWIGCDFLRLEGFLIDGPAVVGGTNVYGLPDADHIQLVANEIRNSICQGIALEPSTSHWTIARNWIHDNGHGCDEQAHGIYLQGDSHIVANNVIENQPEGYGIQVFPYSRGARILNNTIVRSGRGGIVVGGSGCDLAACGVTGTLIANNLLAFNSTYGIAVDKNPPGSCNIRSNLAFANRSGSFANGWPAHCLGANITANPLFVNAATGNYHVRARSPAIDAGAADVTVSPDRDGIRRSRGRGPDIGAYER